MNETKWKKSDEVIMEVTYQLIGPSGLQSFVEKRFADAHDFLLRIRCGGTEKESVEEGRKQAEDGMWWNGQNTGRAEKNPQK